MKNSLHIGTYFGIPVKIHWTFGLLVLFLVYTAVSENANVEQGLWFGGYVATLFLCVILHEYGHALAAKRYGVNTKDIILSPIGGVARLEQLPDRPKHELVIALAGPLVNVVIAVIVFVGLLFFADENLFSANFDILNIGGFQEFFLYILAINITLFVFNLIPAFPMDGGRVLRSLLAMKIGRVKATKYASLVGRVLAIAFVVIGISNSMYVLAIIGVFIYMSASAEYQHARVTTKLEEFKVSDIMRSQFTRLHIGDPLSLPLDLYKRNVESSFLVFDSLGYLVGSLPQLFLVEFLKNNESLDEKVGNVISKKVAIVSQESSLKDIYKMMNENGIDIIGVGESQNIIGVVDRTGIRRVLS